MLFILWFIFNKSLFFLVWWLNLVFRFKIKFGNFLVEIFWVILGFFFLINFVIFNKLICLLVVVINCLLLVCLFVIVKMCSLVMFFILIIFNGICGICFIELFNKFFNKWKFFEMCVFNDGLKIVIGLIVVNFIVVFLFLIKFYVVFLVNNFDFLYIDKFGLFLFV